MRGFHTGHLLSFVIYWVASGTIFPILILGTPVIMVSIIIGGVIGVTEEISIKQVLWHHISCNMVLVWHIAPQSVLPNQMPGGIASFLFYALLLGLDWGLVAWRTGSIKWVIAGHCIHDSLGLSGFAFLQSNGTLRISFFCKG